MSCLLVGALMVMLDGPDFSLRWTHSVERSAWREDWRVEGDHLRLVRAAVKGSGAGMESGEGAILRDGWYEWAPTPPPVPELILAASGATGGGWQLCAGPGACRELGATGSAPLHLRPCP
ncbi:DUF1850 domain-containing protein [Paracoccus sp. p4-l81]|uniref:DUF1850 domain-containing protein n=1 Tax=Paracoccus sp. p4-l81 TaxID=3342806 RepID=UPI0035B9E89D